MADKESTHRRLKDVLNTSRSLKSSTMTNLKAVVLMATKYKMTLETEQLKMM